jgi:hypothetical protein
VVANKSDCLHAQDLACYNLDVGGEMTARGHEVRIWKKDSVLSPDKLTRKADLFISHSSSIGPGKCSWRKARNQAVVCGQKCTGPRTRSILSPKAVHRDARSLSFHAGPSAGTHVSVN